MSELIAKVEQLYKQKKFSEMPRGPLGRYIQVNDKKYRQAIENILGSFLQFFMVNNDKDRILLSNVLKQYPDLSRTTIITTKFQNRVYDVRAGKVKLNQGNGKVIMDAINVSDPVVMNGLIDQMKVETVVLVDNIDTANALTENIEDVPENLFKVWLLEPFTEFYPAPAYRSYAQQMKPSRYLQTDQKEILAGYEYQKQVLTHKMNEFTDEFNNGNERVRVIEKNVAEKRKLCGELQQKHKDYGQKLYNLRNIEYPPEDSHEVLKAELEELSKKQTFIMKKLTEAEEVVTKATKGMKTIQEKYEETKQEFNKLRNEMLVTQNEVELNQMKLNEMHNDLKMKTNQLVVLQRDEENYGKQENEVKTSIAEMISKIKGKRVEKRRNEDQINQMIRSAENQISRIESSNERIEDIESLLNSKTSQYDKMRKVRDAMEIILKTVSEIFTTS
jgi:structural maintenance of chromosomes protein 6